MRVAEDAAGRVAPELLRHPRVRVRVLTEREQVALAEEAAAAGDWKRHHHAIAGLQVLHRIAHFHHLALEFVAEDIALHHAGHETRRRDADPSRRSRWRARARWRRAD